MTPRDTRTPQEKGLDEQLTRVVVLLANLNALGTRKA